MTDSDTEQAALYFSFSLSLLDAQMRLTTTTTCLEEVERCLSTTQSASCCATLPGQSQLNKLIKAVDVKEVWVCCEAKLTLTNGNELGRRGIFYSVFKIERVEQQLCSLECASFNFVRGSWLCSSQQTLPNYVTVFNFLLLCCISLLNNFFCTSVSLVSTTCVSS